MLENPFKPVTKEEDTDPKQNEKLVAAILGPDAAKKYAELDAGREGENGDDLSDLKLTDTEKAVVKEAHENQPWDRNRYIKWATSLGRDEGWVDKMFTFHPDGRVESWDLDLHDITELHEFPQDLKIRGNLYLNSLTSAEGLTLPTEIGGYLDLERLTNADGLTLPEKIYGYLHLASLTSAQGLKLPEKIGNSLYLNNLTSADGLTLPEKIGGGLYLLSLTSAQGLTLPTEIGDELDLRSFTSAEGLIIPKDFHVRNRVHTNPTLRPFFEKIKEEGRIRGDIIVR